MFIYLQEVDGNVLNHIYLMDLIGSQQPLIYLMDPHGKKQQAKGDKRSLWELLLIN